MAVAVEVRRGKGEEAQFMDVPDLRDRPRRLKRPVSIARENLHGRAVEDDDVSKSVRVQVCGRERPGAHGGRLVVFERPVSASDRDHNVPLVASVQGTRAPNQVGDAVLVHVGRPHVVEQVRMKRNVERRAAAGWSARRALRPARPYRQNEDCANTFGQWRRS